MTIVSVTNDVIVSDVRVTWSAPDDNNSPIDIYLIEFMKSDSTFTAIASCDGSNALIAS
jgi:hypothetical protein